MYLQGTSPKGGNKPAAKPKSGVNWGTDED
jgi:hypothetical protein